jgi:parvulin-like peptidyl-prolyl isomerase
MQVFYNQEVSRRINTSDEEVRAAYEENKEQFLVPFKVKFRAILIGRGATEEDRSVKMAQAEDVLKKLQDGADFATLAREVSEGLRADQGGEFPWSDLKDIREELRPSLRALSAGQISGLIETAEEIYIVKVEERREEGYLPFEDVQSSIEKQLLARERSRLHSELMERLAARHYIERF